MSPNPGFRLCRCGALSLVDSDWCEPCEVAEKRRVADSKARGRAKRSAAGLCIDCGRKVSKAEAASKRKVKLCPAHEVKRERFRTRGVTRVVTKTRDRIAAATVVSSLGGEEGRTRYHGQQRKGVPPMATTNALALAKIQKQLTTADTALTLAYSSEHAELPRLQRNSLRTEARAKLGLMLRSGIEMYKRLGGAPEALIANLGGGMVATFVDED